jgi:glutathione S-transferase
MTARGRVYMDIKLYDWAASPFSLKVRAVLDYKGLAYQRVPIIRRANFAHVRQKGRIGKAPALEIGGTLYVDSTDICYELEKRFPSPPVLPPSPRDRARCHAIEEWSDESLYFVGLYFQWFDAEGRKMVPQVFGRGLAAQLTYRFFLRRILRQLQGQGTGRKPPDMVRNDLARHLDAIAQLTADGGFALGSQPYLCDFALLGQLIYLSRTPAGGRLIAERRAIGDYLERMKSLQPSGDAAAARRVEDGSSGV